MKQKKESLSIVVPIYNEEELLPEAIKRFSGVVEKLSSLGMSVELIAVNDGSKDNSLALLRDAAEGNPSIKIIDLSRNFGHQIAITAGIDASRGDWVAVIDADLQDPPELIEPMLRLAQQGNGVVYGKRRSRQGETFFKKATAALFYRLLSYMCELDIPTDTGDFRLMSRQVVNAFNQLRERQRFVRGMVPWVGFRAVPFEYDRQERFAGTTHYPLSKMIFLALNAILSFSKKPLTLAINLGLLTLFTGVVWGIYILYLKLCTDVTVPGFTSILLTMVIFSGVQILLIGVVGEYIARIFEEVKQRPLYLVAEEINFGTEKHPE